MVGEKLFKRIKRTKSGCWNFTGPLDAAGYGMASLNRKSIRAHRLSYLISFGEIPNKLNVCHRCDNRQCINPKHLFLGTQKDNINDMIRKGRAKSMTPNLVFANYPSNPSGSRVTHCIRGHRFTKISTRINNRGHRQCKVCCYLMQINRRKILSGASDQTGSTFLN